MAHDPYESDPEDLSDIEVNGNPKDAASGATTTHDTTHDTKFQQAKARWNSLKAELTLPRTDDRDRDPSEAHVNNNNNNNNMETHGHSISKIIHLMELGFGAKQAVAVLDACGGDVDQAGSLLWDVCGGDVGKVMRMLQN